MSKFVVISFFTAGTPYRIEVERLRTSCQKFGLNHCIAQVESMGNWVRNCSLKGSFIRNQLESQKRPVLWIDADGEIVAPLDFFNEAEFDVGCYVRWSSDRHPPKMDSRDMPFNSGTVFFNYTQSGRKLAALWAQYCRNNPNIWDQECLAWSWWELRQEVQFSLLPQGYCKVVDRAWLEPNESAYVLHHQASRRFKQVIDQHETKTELGTLF